MPYRPPKHISKNQRRKLRREIRLQRKSIFQDCLEFTQTRNNCINQPTGCATIDRKFITRMIQDELQELAEAKDLTEEVDALIDIIYYAAQHLSNTGINPQPIWDLVHQANMTKFGPGGFQDERGKWNKPPNFVPPDDDIRVNIEEQIAKKNLRQFM